MARSLSLSLLFIFFAAFSFSLSLDDASPIRGGPPSIWCSCRRYAFGANILEGCTRRARPHASVLSIFLSRLFSPSLSAFFIYESAFYLFFFVLSFGTLSTYLPSRVPTTQNSYVSTFSSIPWIHYSSGQRDLMALPRENLDFISFVFKLYSNFLKPDGLTISTIISALKCLCQVFSLI